MVIWWWLCDDNNNDGDNDTYLLYYNGDKKLQFENDNSGFARIVRQQSRLQDHNVVVDVGNVDDILVYENGDNDYNDKY